MHFSACQLLISFSFLVATINPATATPIAIASHEHALVERGQTNTGGNSDPGGDDFAKGLACFFTFNLLNECKY
jgi:hypothetical protein